MEQSPIYRRQGEPKWKVIVCTTGPDMWTTSIYEMLVSGQFNNVRVERADFSAFGCQFKISEAKHFQARKSTHYYGTNSRILLLLTYPLHLSMLHIVLRLTPSLIHQQFNHSVTIIQLHHSQSLIYPLLHSFSSLIYKRHEDVLSFFISSHMCTTIRRSIG